MSAASPQSSFLFPSNDMARFISGLCRCRKENSCSNNKHINTTAATLMSATSTYNLKTLTYYLLPTTYNLHQLQLLLLVLLHATTITTTPTPATTPSAAAAATTTTTTTATRTRTTTTTSTTCSIQLFGVHAVASFVTFHVVTLNGQKQNVVLIVRLALSNFTNDNVPEHINGERCCLCVTGVCVV